MKSYILAALLALCASGAFAADANQMQYVQLLAAKSSTADTGAWYDVSPYKGNAVFGFMLGATTTNAYSVTVQLCHATATNGTWVVVTNLAGTAVQKVSSAAAQAGTLTTVPCDLSRLHKWIRVKAAGGNESNEIGAFMVAPMKSE